MLYNYHYDFTGADLKDKITKEEVMSALDNENSKFTRIGTITHCIGYSRESRRIIVFTFKVSENPKKDYQILNALLPYEATIQRKYCKG